MIGFVGDEHQIPDSPEQVAFHDLQPENLENLASNYNLRRFLDVFQIILQCE